MLITLQQQFLTIQSARNDLEIRVQNRTQDLKASNQQLAAEIQQRERIENSLRESEERYDLAVSGTNDAIWDWDIQQQQIYLSPVWQTILGYQPKAIPVTVQGVTRECGLRAPKTSN